MSQPLTLWTNHPLVIDEQDPRPKALQYDWEKEVYPIGNGCLGGTLFGEPRCERLQFNHDTMWVGNEHNTGAYQSFGDVYVKLPHDHYSAYRRELDLDRAVQTVTYEAGGVRFRRECFASRPAQVIVMRLSADQPGALTGAVSMDNIHEIPITAENDALVMRGDTSKVWYWQFQAEDPTRLLSDREYASAENIVLDVEARVRVLHDGGAITTEGNTVTFTGCDSVTLLLAADTNYLADRSKGWRGEHPHDSVCRRIAAAENRSYDELLAEHIADHQQFFGRVALDLGETPAGLASLPTAQRVERYGVQGAVDAEGAAPSDRQLEVLLYQYARYLLIGSSAPGERTLPANLQGIWCIAKRPPWRCDFHTDVNVQMNYWFSQAANLADCFLPLAKWIDSIREVRKEETREVFGVERGWLMRSENGVVRWLDLACAEGRLGLAVPEPVGPVCLHAATANTSSATPTR
jgi:alpha-L-fucosidase 2